MKGAMERAEKWHISEDNEMYFSEVYPTREAAIAAGVSSCDGSFYIGVEAWFWPSVDEDDLLDDVLNQAYDYAGEYAEDWFRDLTSDERAALREKLQRAFDEWISATKREPSFFMVERTELIDPDALD